MTRFTPLWVQAGDFAAQVDRRLFAGLWPFNAVSGMTVSPASGMTVNIQGGQAVIDTSNGTGKVLCASNAAEQVTHAPAPASGQSRIDVIYAQFRATDVDGGSNNDWLFAIAQGTATTGTPAVPSIPINSVAIAQVIIPGASISVTAPNILDVRPARLSRPWNSAWGLLDFAQTSTSFAGPITGTDVQIPNMSTNFAGPANRQIRTHLRCAPKSTAAGDIINVKIATGGAVQLAITRAFIGHAGYAQPLDVWYIEQSDGTAHNRLGRTQAEIQTGTCTLEAGPLDFMQMIIEDIGPVPGTTGT